MKKWGQHRAAARGVKEAVKKDKEFFIQALAEKLETAVTRGHMRVLYQTIKILTGNIRSSSKR